MRRVLFVVSVFVLVAGVQMLPAQNWAGLENDFETLFESLGRDILPHMQQASILGDGLYDAEREHYGNLFVALTTGAVFSDGFKDDVDSGNYEVLNAPALMEDAFGELPSSVSGFYDSLFPYPVLRVAVGFGVGDAQFAALVSGMPRQLVGGLTNDAVDVGALNLGLRGRKTLISEIGALPAIAVGGGYTFSTLGIAYSLDDFSQDANGDTLTIQGDLSISGTVHTAGLDLYASKSLAFLVPFLRISPYLQRSRYLGTVDNFDATQGGNSFSDSTTADDPEAEVISYDLAMLLATGFDIRLGKSAIFLHGNYSTGTGSFGADLGFRLGF